MAITLNGNGTITGYTPPVADGSITAAKLATGVGGKVLQAKHVVKSDPFTTKTIAIVAGNNMNFDAYLLGDMNGSYADVLAAG